MNIKDVPAPVIDRRPPWERSLPLPSNVPACVEEARNRWYFNCGIYAPLDVLLRAYAPHGKDTVDAFLKRLPEEMENATSDWVSGYKLFGFTIHEQPCNLQGLDALLFGILPGRYDEHDIRFEYDDNSTFRALFSALGAYIREMYPKVGDTRNAREDGLDYRVLASLAEHGVDPTDDDRDPELAAQWEACQKDTLVLGSFYALQRIGEFINNLFPEKAGEDGAE